MARSTVDVVVLILAATVAFVLVLVTVGLVVVADDPSGGTVRSVAESVGGVLSLFVGVVVGYVARSAVANRRDSGTRPPTDSP